jgi:transposase
MITNKQKGLSVKGVKINVPIDQIKNKNISLLMAITTNGIIKTNISKDNTNSTIFFDFIKNIISDLTEDNYIFLFDNVPFHKNKEMLKYIEDNGHKHMFVPAYSPNNNPIENTFSVVKKQYYNNIKDTPKTEKNIIYIVQKTIQDIKEKYKDFTSFYNRSFHYDYKAEESELRDRITFRDNYIKESKTQKHITAENLNVNNNVIGTTTY